MSFIFPLSLSLSLSLSLALTLTFTLPFPFQNLRKTSAQHLSTYRCARVALPNPNTARQDVCNSVSTSQPETLEHTHKICVIRFVALYLIYRLFLLASACVPPQPFPLVFGCVQTKLDFLVPCQGQTKPNANKPRHEHRHIGRRSARTGKSQAQAKQTDRRGFQPAQPATPRQQPSGVPRAQ